MFPAKLGTPTQTRGATRRDVSNASHSYRTIDNRCSAYRMQDNTRSAYSAKYLKEPSTRGYRIFNGGAP